MGAGFGDLLREHRLAAGLTQEALAARAGISVDAIGLLERGARRAPRMSTVALLAEAMALNPGDREALRQAARRGARPRPAGLDIPPELLVPATSLVGRDAVVAQVVALLRRPDVRLLTLTGPPGVGKTRLALEAAASVIDDHEHGVIPVALAPVPGPELVAPTLRRALGVREEGGRPPLETVLEHCRDRGLLLVLDNFEHLLAATPLLVELLGRCPALSLLVTSRASLRIRGEHELPVPPLGAGPAVTLFVERATAASPGFDLTAANRAAVEGICERLDGLPLALELAAPWVKLLAPETMLERLDQPLSMLATQALDLPERQRTMRATLAWSGRLLTAEQRALFRRLSVFTGSAPLDGIESVCQAAGPLTGGVLDGLAVLVDHSLVRQQENAAGTRLTMLETVREYGRELLEAAGEEAATARAHAEHYAALAAAADQELRGARQGAWLERLDHELDNVRAALGWAAGQGEVELGLGLATHMRRFWDRRGHRQEGLAWLERLLAAGGPVSPGLRAEALGTAGTMAWMAGAFDASRRHGEEGLALFRELGDPRGIAFALRVLGQLAGALGHQDQALALYEQAEPLLREIEGDPHDLANVLMHIGVTLARMGERHREIAYHEEALAMRRQLGDRLGVALCLLNLADAFRFAGDHARARVWLEEAVSISRELGAPFQLAAALSNLGDLARDRTDPVEARAHYEESLRLFARIGNREGVAYALECLAWAAWAEGDPAAAARLYGALAALDVPAPPADTGDRTRFDATRAAVRAALSADAYVLAFETGRRLPPDEVLSEPE